MSVCKRCGASFSCAMVDGNDGTPCWCTAMPPAVPVPSAATGLTCWCPDCLKQHVAGKNQQPAPGSAPDSDQE